VQDDGSPAATGEVGAVQVRGPNLFHQYWQKPEATAAAFARGWFDTGDLGQLDAAGVLTPGRRKDDMTLTTGYQRHPPGGGRWWSGCWANALACGSAPCWESPIASAASAWPRQSSRATPPGTKPLSAAGGATGSCITSSRRRSCWSMPCRRTASAKCCGESC